MIGTSVSHYKILEKLGGGGAGVVYKAQDLKLDRYVALKFFPPELTLEPEAKGRFIHEAKAASALDHSNICNVHEIAKRMTGRSLLSWPIMREVRIFFGRTGFFLHHEDVICCMQAIEIGYESKTTS